MMIRFLTTIVFLGSASCFGQWATAESPESIERGRRLFERAWTSQDPSFGSDGLGPVFNSDSCVACHHQGGVGGGGDSRFNAQALGIESLRFGAEQTTRDELSTFLRSFYPGFLQANGSVLNTAPIHHHGVTPQFAALRESILKSAPTGPSDEGGPLDVEASRLNGQAPIIFSKTVGNNQITAKARLFQRNTTALFGAGLIDSVEDSDIHRQAKIQERHPEVSGRASILRNGSLGRFGWRANVSRLAQFVDRACANELGLETKRRRQPQDPTRPNYHNSAIDVSDDQILQMSDFLSNLPAPIQRLSEDPSERQEINRGQEAFSSVGCAVCHVPQLGPAAGIYSDLLLHDMGPYLFDFDAAEPYVVRQNLSHDTRLAPESVTAINTTYYGAPTPITIRGYWYESPRGTTAQRDYVTLSKIRELGEHTIARMPGKRVNLTARISEELGLERRLRPSNTTQEWRTPPLWGLRDSAPYLHDGRAETVLEAIAMHDGEAAGSRDRFLQLPLADRQAMLAFLETLVAPANVPQSAL